MRILFVLGAWALLGFVSASPNTRCNDCKKELCPKLSRSECLTGIVKDGCDCCDVCARMESQTCDLPETPYVNGKCGDGLSCEETEFGQVCVCEHDQIICGSNNVTYNNMCGLMADMRRAGLKSELEVKFVGPCDAGAKIVSSPMYTKNSTGGTVILSCEAVGNPTPHIAWLYTRADGETFSVPGDDEFTLTAARGGPGRYQITGWVQIEGLRKTHEGDYTCIVQNKYKKDTAKARVKVVPRK
ncbi:hypothetical protein LOTGIDRAFT_184700 [Lottia gigantea]|uniref:Uncharacterized protein n=1 Tax=Lottia gigantea TaxID=225164 RepID=V3ZKI4_LOTGI|nr:hypothetical protein LOTGIDRAFT_184700 [Lottia gigantea]ESO82900.1 hypothetical protein LOTGIDRAFT_184700 [Lottia gigantea]